MFTRKRFWRLVLASPLAGAVFAGGCLATVQQNLDILFSPSATRNLLAFPTSAVEPLIEFLLSIFGG